MYYEFKEKDKDRASAILKQLKGMSMTEAQGLLDWCKGYLMDHITVDFNRSLIHKDGGS